MASKVHVSVKLDLDHELGHDHYQTWRSQLEIAFELHGVTEKKKRYLAAAANLAENASYYLWQKFPTMPTGDDPFADLIELFDEYFGSQRSTDSRLAELFSIEQQPGESIQAFRVRIEKEMRVCHLTPSTDVKEILGTVAVHLFARGLTVKAARKSVLEEGGKDLTAAAKRAQAVVLSRETPSKEVEVSYAAPSSRQNLPSTACGYCGGSHIPGKRHCPAAEAVCDQCGKKGHFGRVCRSAGKLKLKGQVTGEEQRVDRRHNCCSCDTI